MLHIFLLLSRHGRKLLHSAVEIADIQKQIDLFLFRYLQSILCLGYHTQKNIFADGFNVLTKYDFRKAGTGLKCTVANSLKTIVKFNN